ncbi:MAG: MMPL family transporter [Gemmatimonadales bacterium]|nr:MMPL family transporter [Gemmatimonadales bacterium]
MRGRWVVVAVWAVLGAFAGLRAPGTLALLDIRGGSDRPTEASRAEDQLTRRFSRPVDEFFAATLDGPGSFDSPSSRAVLDSLIRALEAQPYVRGVVSYPSTRDTTFVSRDRRSTFLVIALETGDGDSAAAWVAPTRTIARRAVASAAAGSVAGSGAYTVRVTGRAPLDLDVRKLVGESSRRGERQLIPLTLIILVLAFGALVAALLPLLTGVLAIAVSLTAIGVLARHTPMWVFVLNVISMVGLGVGIDYSLLVVTRFREEMAGGLDPAAAAVRTVLTAGSAVFTSGLTVAVGFGALLLTPLIETRSVGLGGLIVVTVAVLLSTTLLPALLAILGWNIDRPRGLARRLAWYHAPGLWEKWARALGRHPGRALVLGGSVILLLAIPLFQLRIGLPSRRWWPSGTEAGDGLDALSKMGVAGFILPIRILVEAPAGRTIVQAASLRGLKMLSDSLRADPRVREVRGLVDLAPGTSLLGYSVLYSDLAAARREYPAFLDAYLSDDRRTALLDVIPADTVSLTTAQELVGRARELAHTKFRSTRGMTIFVGGYSASALDFQEDLLERFPLLVGLILAATALMLAVAFRSVLVPLKAIVMNSLSVAATFGLIVLVFQRGIGARIFGLDGPTSAIFVVVPVLVFAVVFGLSMDYEVFLLSRIKEAYDRTGRNTEATMEGVRATASVITSAALVMILVFGVFAFADVLILQLLGFGLAVAVLLDATVIRMVLVPAFMQLAGRWNWWPGGRRSTER